MKNGSLTGYPSIDKPWLKYYSEEAIHASIPECTVYEELWQENSADPDGIALIYYGRKITYGELFENIERVRCALLREGVRKDDKVILLSLSTPESVYLIYALCRIGATVNLINPVFSDEQIRGRINETRASLMILLDQFYDKADVILRQTCIQKIVIVPFGYSMPRTARIMAMRKIRKRIRYSNQILSWKDFLNEGKSVGAVQDAPYEKDRSLVMVYSSGTTGASKGIVLTNDGIEATVLHYKNTFCYHRGDRFLNIGILWFSTGVVVLMIMPLNLGITVVLEPIFSETTFTDDLKRYKPNMGFGTTSMWLYAMRSSKLKNVDFSVLRYPITGGERMLANTEDNLNRFLSAHGCNASLIKGWGMCELGSTISSDTETANRRGAAGIPLVDVSVSAFDVETGKEQKCGVRGELRVQSPGRMKEYFNNPDATDRFFWTDDNGSVWGCTGDIGYIDKDGFVYVLGRANDTFLSCKKRRIYCFDIEKVILDNPDIAQCEVVGLPISEGYDIPVAHLILRESCGTDQRTIIREIHKVCSERLETDLVPKGYKICTGFPVKSGKRDMEAIKRERSDFLMPDGDQLKRVSF